ncbi:surfeit locus protein 1-like [Babylonia areolata]|uniref:surfeit locus protein 1-like n=1 Tax=Babylonia areolata TaxID=304850 RepID=UPI003FD0D601
MRASKFAQILRLLVPKQAWAEVIRRGAQTQSPRLSKAVKQHQAFGESGYPLLVIPLATFCLGTWQVKRRLWKLDLIESLEKKTQSAPVPLPLNLEEVLDLEYRPVTLRGEFDHSREMILGPRSNVLKEGGGLVSVGNQTGANIITPFKLADREETILVNRGWVASNQIDPRTRQAGQVQGTVDISGIVRLQEQRPPFMPKSDQNSQSYWLYRDLEAMAKKAGTAPVFIDQDQKTSVPGGPQGGQTRVTLRNEHMSYIITWYSLSLITFIMWFRRYRRPPPPDAAVEFLKKRQQRP